MKYSRITAACGLALMAMALSGCDMTTPTQLRTGQMQVGEAMRVRQLPAGRLDPDQVNVVADDYMRNGKGPVRIVAPYKAGSPLERVTAERQGNLYKKAFARRGVAVLVNYIPVHDGADAENLVVSYAATQAAAPADCMRLTGSGGASTLSEVQRYRMGCELDTAMSAMIAHPEDLMGVAGTPDDYARRQGAIVEHYRAGTSNPPLNGLNASTTGTTTVTGGGLSTGSKNPSNGGGG